MRRAFHPSRQLIHFWWTIVWLTLIGKFWFDDQARLSLLLEKSTRFVIFDPDQHPRLLNWNFDDVGEHDIPLDRDRSPNCWYLAECVLHDRHSALLDRDYDNRADLSVSSYGIASPFRGPVTLDGWPECDIVIQFIVCQVDRFLDETAVRHLNVAFCTFTIPANGTNVGRCTLIIIIVTKNNSLEKD